MYTGDKFLALFLKILGEDLLANGDFDKPVPKVKYKKYFSSQTVHIRDRLM